MQNKEKYTHNTCLLAHFIIQINWEHNNVGLNDSSLLDSLNSHIIILLLLLLLRLSLEAIEIKRNQTKYAKKLREIECVLKKLKVILN